MITIDIADKLRRAHTSASDDRRLVKWRDLTSVEKAPWVRQAELVQRWIEEAQSHDEELDGEFDYD